MLTMQSIANERRHQDAMPLLSLVFRFMNFEKLQLDIHCPIVQSECDKATACALMIPSQAEGKAAREWLKKVTVERAVWGPHYE